jgi:nucleoside-diphosphate-sugar epimerase
METRVSGGCLVVTGASGFVGRHLVEHSVRRGWRVRPVSRTIVPGMMNVIQVKSLAHSVYPDGAPWDTIFAECESAPPVVVHLAARAHILDEAESDPLSAFRRANVDVALNVAKEAFARGVRRFVLVSSIGAVGEESQVDRPLGENATCRPMSPYGVSKLEAELALQRLAEESNVQLIVLRPPLVYGPNAPGNLQSLKRWIKKGVPFPFAGIRNQRSLIHVENLCDAILRCAQIEHNDFRVFHVRDNRDYATPEIIHSAAQAMNCQGRLFRFPVGILKGLSALPGRARSLRGLIGNLQVDDRLIRRELGFLPKNFPIEL